jgi:Zn-dependent membrane protease YugP
MFFDYYYLILVVPAIIFVMIAQASVKSAYNKYSKQFSRRGLTGAQAAQLVLDANDVRGIQIYQIEGTLSDNFNPSQKAINLSSGVYGSTSLAAIGVACHEAGHAVQYANEYFPLQIRNTIIPISQIGSKFAMPLIIIGIVLGYFSEKLFNIIWIGIAFFAAAVLFELITLPVEFNASRRAIKAIESNGILDEEETVGAKKVLKAAAMTYVAALAVSLGQLLRFVLIAMGGRRRD